MADVTIPRAKLTGQAAYLASAFADLKAATDSPPANASTIQAKVAELGQRLAGAASIAAQYDGGADISVYAGTGCTPKRFDD